MSYRRRRFLPTLEWAEGLEVAEAEVAEEADLSETKFKEYSKNW
jgi:hypothetical protein